MATTLEDTIRNDFESSGGISSLTNDILAISQDIDATYLPVPDGSEPIIECRIQYHNGIFGWYTGQPCYDTDHRGHWGASVVTQNMTREEARNVAGDLLDQVIESAYQEDGE